MLVPHMPDLRYIADYVDGAAHDRLLAAVDSRPWQTSAGREVQVYGYRYHHPTRAAYRIGELPEWATELGRRLCRDGLLPAMPDQLVVNAYQSGSGIVAHVDQLVFGDTVASISLGSTCVMQFCELASGRRAELFLEPRSALVLSGEARSAWTHAIPARHADVWGDASWPRSRRVSLTFRIMPG